LNQHSILRFGSTFEFVEMRLRKEGYACEWSCMNAPGCDGGGKQWPDDFEWKGSESGWEMRRKIKAWCAKHDVKDFRIVRNTGYCRDLHGVVYELWIRRKGVAR
jgi:hypothetical protein